MNVLTLNRAVSIGRETVPAERAVKNPQSSTQLLIIELFEQLSRVGFKSIVW